MHADESEPNFSIDPDNTLNRLHDWFDEAVKLPADAREAWMAAHIDESDDREALRRLLAADTRESIFETSACELDARIVAAELRFDILIGSEIGDFRIVRELGQGGMAAVFLCERINEDFHQQAAIKLLHRGLYSDFEQQLFRRERQVLASLEHPHIARLIDGGVTANRIPYLVMEYVDGVPITQYVRDHGLDLTRRLRLFVEVCRAVEAAHQRLVVHRDIKPSNILVTAAGEPKLLDFGIAKLIEEDAGRATQTLRFYTPGYAAPEQTDGGTITTATDVYSLGVLLHELLLGQRPEFTATGEPQRPSSSADNIVVRRTAKPASTPPAAETLQHLRRQLRGDLDNIVLKALESDPQRRYASAGALAEDIERHLDGRPVVAHPPTRWYRTRKFLQRHRGGAAVTAILAVAVLAALGVALWQAGVAHNEASRANAVRDFLVHVFDAAKANLPANERPTPETLVREAAKRAREDASIPPALRASFLKTLGDVSVSLGNYREADALLDEALSWQTRAGGAANARDRLELIVGKADVLAITDRNTAAQALLDGILPDLRAQDSSVAVDGLQLHANIDFAEGRYDEAVQFAREAAAKIPHAYAADTLDSMHAASFLGVMLAAVQRYRESIAELDPLLAHWRTLGFPLDMNYAVALNNLAAAKGALGDTAGAETLLREGIALRRRIYGGKPHDRLAGALDTYARFLIARERFDEAHVQLDEALSIYKAVFGPDHSMVAASLYSIGLTEIGQRRSADAEGHLRNAVAIYAMHAEDNGMSDELASTRAELAIALAEQGKTAEADDQIASAFGALHAQHGEKIPDAAQLKLLPAATRVALIHHDFSKALDLTAQVRPLLASQRSPSPSLVSLNAHYRAVALAGANRRDEALAEVESALATLHAGLPDAHSRIAAMLVLRAELERAAGNEQGADASLAEARALNVPASLLAPQDAAALAGAKADPRR